MRSRVWEGFGLGITCQIDLIWNDLEKKSAMTFLQ